MKYWCLIVTAAESVLGEGRGLLHALAQTKSHDGAWEVYWTGDPSLCVGNIMGAARTSWGVGAAAPTSGSCSNIMEAAPTS